MRFVLALLVALIAGPALSEGPPRPGLMWNKTGLPAVFPLQVKTNPGRDFILTLIDQDTGTEALAAFIEGGEFFRVLVPPGSYRLRFDYGAVWHGDEQRFANPDTIELEDPLTFEVRGIGRKAGHLVDLTSLSYDHKDASAATTRPQSLCQVSSLEVTSNCLIFDDSCTPPDDIDRYKSPYAEPAIYDFTYTVYTRLCD